jgi:hypothetical protein
VEKSLLKIVRLLIVIQRFYHFERNPNNKTCLAVHNWQLAVVPLIE